MREWTKGLAAGLSNPKLSDPIPTVPGIWKLWELKRAADDEPVKCYLHEVDDPNETHFDEDNHHICLVCAVKLWEIAKDGFEFEMRNKIVCLNLVPEVNYANTNRS